MQQEIIPRAYRSITEQAEQPSNPPIANKPRSSKQLASIENGTSQETLSAADRVESNTATNKDVKVCADESGVKTTDKTAKVVEVPSESNLTTMKHCEQISEEESKSKQTEPIDVNSKPVSRISCFTPNITIR